MTFQELERELQRVDYELPGAVGTPEFIQLMALRDTLQRSVIKYYRLGYGPERLVA